MKSNTPKKSLSTIQENNLISLLAQRFEKNMHRHKGLKWTNVEQRIRSNKEKLWSLNQMESTGGEPDVIGLNTNTGQIIFCDCSIETPSARRSLCYDGQALDARKENKPEGNVLDMAEKMGISLLSESEYRQLQELEKMDLKTSSWIQTPEPIRKLGGALFCDRRYNTVFVYHNGASSYYAARGFRGLLEI